MDWIDAVDWLSQVCWTWVWDQLRWALCRAFPPSLFSLHFPLHFFLLVVKRWISAAFSVHWSVVKCSQSILNCSNKLLLMWKYEEVSYIKLIVYIFWKVSAVHLSCGPIDCVWCITGFLASVTNTPRLLFSISNWYIKALLITFLKHKFFIILVKFRHKTFVLRLKKLLVTLNPGLLDQGDPLIKLTLHLKTLSNTNQYHVHLDRMQGLKQNLDIRQHWISKKGWFILWPVRILDFPDR